MTNSTAVQDWIRIHRLLLERETAFTDLALRAVAGEVTTEHLAQQRAALIELRERCSAAYENAFPDAARATRARTPAGPA